MTRAGLMCVAVPACAATLAACGSGGSKTVVKTVTAPQPSPASTTTTATTAEPTTQSTSQPQPTAGQSPLHLSFFRSPSANIGCVIAEGIARCDIRNRNWSPPPRPRSCYGDTGYGQGLIVGITGRAHFVCAGDTALDPSGRTLPYGRDSQVDGFTCHSAADGITCTSTGSGHGFLLNRERYRIF